MTCQRLFAAFIALAIGSLFFSPSAGGQSIHVTRIASGLSRPVLATAAPGDDNRLFIVEQHTGQIKILDRAAGTINPTPFLDFDGLSTNNEQGLLGLAFHPNYVSNGLFYVNLTNSTGTTEIRRYQVSANPDIANAASVVTMMTIAQPQSNHNAGWIEFGPNDGFLYIATGDGGGSDDNDAGHTVGTGNAQDITSNLLGKILRIDVNGDDFPGDPARNYAVPAGNPFVGVTGDDEIWAFGLRNPYRNGFDRLTGDLYIADVGQNSREEINVQPGSSTGGENYGWRLREGTIATPTGGVGGDKPPGAIDPIHEYLRNDDGGYAVVGGYVYRGPHPALQGQYFFADNVTSNIWSLEFNGDPPSEHDGTNYTNLRNWNDGVGPDEFIPDVGVINSIASFGEDNAGNLFIVDLGGEVFALPSTPPTPGDAN
ncbi:MAG: PQQ-dependent sugar dehydrogenase, partial [Pirellulaceae bacterium]|nr:PQQ-dependent sugar dehydrogenase [Pirellulaceae bacterium]